MHTLPLLRALPLALLLLGALPAQTGLIGWNRDGQTWLVWNDNLTFAGVESMSIYRSSNPITTLAELQAAERVGRLFPQDWQAARLQIAAPGATWTIPDAGGSPRVLAGGEGLFVYTPHAAVVDYFAVVKTENLATGPFSSSGPIAQTLDPIVPHRQRSGVNALHPYDIYTYWLDGRDDPNSGVPGFPVMGSASFHGVPSVFAVFEPRTGLPPAPMPAVVFLHGGGGSYWTNRPSASSGQLVNLHVDNGLQVTPDEGFFMNVGGVVTGLGTRWFGTCVDYDRFQDVTVVPPNGTLVGDFAQRRLAWILDWLQATQGVDPLRTAMGGLSMGGRGTHMFARARPERLSASLSFVMPMTFGALGIEAIMGSETQNLPTTLPGNPGVVDVLEPLVELGNLDRPFARYVDGTNDLEVPWSTKPALYDTLDSQRSGAAIYWDSRGHTAASVAGWAGQFFTGSPKHSLEYLTRYRVDQSFPAFHDVDHDVGSAGHQPDPGDPVVPANGAPWGTRGGWFDWEPASIVDTTTSWSCRLWLATGAAWPADNAPLPNARASVTLRRLQAFDAAPHEVLWVTLARAVAPFTVLFAGAVQADADGTITLPDLPFGPVALDLSVERVAAGGPLVPYGVAAAGCAGSPLLGGNSVPQVNTPGFALAHTNAPANGVGITALGLLPANASVLGLQLHVEPSTPPAVLLVVVSGPAGGAMTPLAIPNHPALAGYRVYAQGLWLDACASGGLAATRGLAITVQP